MAPKLMKIGILVVLITLFVAQAAYANCTYSGTGDWIIDSTESCANTSEVITLNGNLTINGELNFTNVTLKVNATTQGGFKIFLNGSTTKFNVFGGSNITNESAANSYNITVDNGTLIINNSVIEMLNNLTLSNSALANFTNVTFNRSNISIADSTSNLTVKWYVDVYVNDTNGVNTSATVVINDTANNNHFSGASSASTGMITQQVLPEFWRNNATWYYYSLYNISASNAWGSNNTTLNLTSDKTGSNNITLTVTAVPNCTITALNTSITLPPLGLQIVEVNITNTGGLTDNFTLNTSLPTGWSYDIVNSTVYNMVAGSYTSANLRIIVGSNGQPDSMQTLTLYCYSHRNAGAFNTSTMNVTVDDALEYATITQNATDWIEGNESSQGIWGPSNYTTAWVLWTLNTTANSSITNITNTTSIFNATQHASGYWLDDVYENNTTTAMVIIAYKEAGYANNSTNGNLTLAANYLMTQAKVDANHAWPSTTNNAYTTAVILTALYKEGTYNSNTSAINATKWLVGNLTNASTGNYTYWSWGNNTTNTSWGIWATKSGYGYGNLNSTEQTKRNAAVLWLKHNQSRDGYFGSSANIYDTAMAVIALKAEGVALTDTWEIDIDKNFSTTYDRYNASLEQAIYWIYTQRNTSSGGWGLSPTSALGSSLGTLALGGSYATVSGQVQGSGNASGFNITGVNVTFGSYTAQTNSSGHYKLNVPAGTYSWDVAHINFTANSSTGFVLGNGESRTQNILMLPGINITGFYGTEETSNKYLSTASPAASATYNISATAVYKYNTSRGVNGTYYYSLNVSTVSGPYASNATTGYFMQGGLTAPAVTVQTAYTTNLSINDSYGSYAETAKTLTVTVVATGDPATDSSGGPPGSTSDYGLSFLEYSHAIKLAQGETQTIKVKIKNSGTKSLENVALSIVSINSDWYSSKVSGTSSGIEGMLDSGEVVTYDVTFNIPATADPKTYSGTWRVKDSGGNALAEKAMNLTITGTAVTTGNGTQNETKIGGLGLTLPDISGSGVVIMLIIVLGGAAAGFVIWYKFFRMVPISDIKKNITMYSSGGARLEGVVKSVTETKKGKVFMIADHTGKLHVRYPYYTTIEKGDLIRSKGVMKTYKEVPYMDAVDLLRVTVKHKGM
ncbi:MAG: NEW3 domain-containing protein [archaeon]